jgi:hypothetical protein
MFQGSSYQTWVNRTDVPGNVCTKYNCPNPSTINTLDPNQNCKIFRCVYETTSANDFFISDTTTVGQAGGMCQPRCGGGAGPDVPLLYVISGFTDLNCYRAPTIQFRCKFLDGTLTNPIETAQASYDPTTGVYSSGDGSNYCRGKAGSTESLSGPIDANGQICDYSYIDPSSLSWVGVPPGDGLDSGGAYKQRARWFIDVFGPAKACDDVGARPYFSVLGGDVAAGPGFGTGCTSDGNASVIGSGVNATPFNGASGQLAALALGQIRSFATSTIQTPGTQNWFTSLVTNAQSTSGSKLAFANTPGTVGGPTYGGSFGRDNWCAPDYYSGTNVNGANNLGGANVAAGSLPAGVSIHSGDLTLTAGTIPSGRKVTLLVTGNVYITGDVKYADAGSIADLPQFRLLVKGNINVDNAVGRLDGFYDAQGSTGLGGIFASCGLASGPINDDTAINGCNNPLTVNGGLAAGIVFLNRTVGDINGQFNQSEVPGETIIFSPQFWAPSPNPTKAQPWQSLTSLPPIL